jgi:hypothetical protein
MFRLKPERWGLVLQYHIDIIVAKVCACCMHKILELDSYLNTVRCGRRSRGAKRDA